MVVTTCTLLCSGCHNHAHDSVQVAATMHRRVTQVIRGQELADFVLGYQHPAFRLELRECYHEAEEAEPLGRFLAGEPDYSWNEDWAALIASLQT
jgi:uncharacterized protein DUF6879